MRSHESPTSSCSPARHRSWLRRNAGLAARAIVLTSAFAAIPSSGTAQSFGGSVLVAGGYILVGEAAHEREPGTVWVFARNGGGWSSVAALRGPTPRTGDGFGTALARSGNFVVVGARGSDEGAVYIYRLEDVGNVNAQPSSFLAIEQNQGFGNVLAASGDNVMVSTGTGEQGEQTMGMFAVGPDGSSGWGGGPTVTAPASFGRMGSSALVLGQDLLALGDPFNDVVHLFERTSGGDRWEPAGTLTPPGEPSQGTFFGYSLAIGGNELLVGQFQAGVIHRYAKVDGAWQSVGTLEPGNDEMRAGYGASLAVDGETLLVGGTQQFDEYRRSGDEWIRTGGSPLYNADGALASTGTGLHLGDQVAVLADPTADFGLGAVTVFSRESGGWQQAARLVADHEPLPAITGGEITCEDGEAAGYDCDEVDLLAFVPWEELGAARGARLNDVWGWTDPRPGASTRSSA